jgi:hypothetical protein
LVHALLLPAHATVGAVFWQATALEHLKLEQVLSTTSSFATRHESIK